MNFCFVIGKVVSEVEFKFLCDKKHVSISKCSLKLCNKSIINIFGFDEIADFLYSKINVGDTIVIEGILTEKEIEIKKLDFFNKTLQKD